MANEIFICHSSIDRDAAVAVVDELEAAHIGCWIAPRDVRAGSVYAQEITDAITRSPLVIAMASANANDSVHVLNEINWAVKQNVPVLPTAIDSSTPSNALLYYLDRLQRFDASAPPLDRHLPRLVQRVRQLLGPATVELEKLHIDRAIATDGPPAPHTLPARPQVSRGKPVCILMLVDQSFSMHQAIAGTDLRKRDAVADTVNRVLLNAIDNSTKEDGVRHYFDVGIIGYGVNNGVASTFAEGLASITWVADHPLRFETRIWEEEDGEGGVESFEEELPVWFEPLAKGKTLMNAAFAEALPLVRGWIAAHPDSFPPIVLNITDGGFSDGDPTPLAREIQDLSTEIGNALVFNCHLSEKVGQPIMFPAADVADKLDDRARQLYEMSSPIPEMMREQAIALGYDVDPGAHGYVRNADLASLVDFLDIGTRPVWDAVPEA